MVSGWLHALQGVLTFCVCSLPENRGSDCLGKVPFTGGGLRLLCHTQSRWSVALAFMRMCRGLSAVALGAGLSLPHLW